MSIVFIGVNYKTPEKTMLWIHSIKSTNPMASVIVVDNSKSFNENLELDIQKMGYVDVLYYDAKENLGYFNGAAFGFHKLDIVPDWVVVSNVDIELKTSDIEKILLKYKTAGAVAPAIISADSGFDKNPYRLNRNSKKAMLIKKIGFSNPVFGFLYGIVSDIRGRVITKKHMDVPMCEEGESVYLPYGACFFFSKAFFESGCRIDFPLFLFGEELYVAEQCRRVGLDIVYVPSIRFLNSEHASTSALMKDSVRKYNYQAMSYILKEYYNE